MTSEYSSLAPHARRWLHHPAGVPLALLVLTLLMFGDTIFTSSHPVLSHRSTDGFTQYLSWRDFGFAELRKGNLALWNPHVFSGMPMLGNFQSALLYPVNWVHLVLPVDKGINVEIALNVFLAGLGMHFWARHKKLHPVACLTSACLWMFGGPFFLKIFPGHLSPLGAMCWIPWLLLAADWLIEGQTRRGILLGMFALAMQILAGHPQTVFVSAVTLAIYIALRFPRSVFKARVAGGVLAVGVGALALAAAHLGAGYSVFAESTRAGGGIPKEFVKSFALPPENFLTLVMPHFLRSDSELGYWGRAYLWEVCLFAGVSGALFAVYALIGRGRETKSLWAATGVLWLLAASAYTPFFDLFYNFLPGFDKFRAHGRFIIPAGAFVALLGAISLDFLLKMSPQSESQARRLKEFAVALFATCALLLGLGAWMKFGQPAFWQGVVNAIAASGQSFTPPAILAQPGFAATTLDYAAGAVLLCAALIMVVALLFWYRLRSHHIVYVVALLAVSEMFVWARSNRPTFPLEATKPAEFAQFFAAQNKHERSLNIGAGNIAVNFRAHDIWGYDPIVLGRYMSFMAWTQNLAPDNVTAADIFFKAYHPLYAMLRCRYLSLPSPEGRRFGEVPGAPLPHVLLMRDYEVASGRDAVFKALGRQDFEPGRTVILESEPNPRPVKANPNNLGAARVVESSSDFLVIEASTPTPAILLVTDSYSQDWKAWGLEGSTQQEYSVLPANYVLRAIPIQAGTHRIRLEYLPRGFVVGKWISLTAWLIYALFLAWRLSIWRRKKAPDALPHNPA